MGNKRSIAVSRFNVTRRRALVSLLATLAFPSEVFSALKTTTKDGLHLLAAWNKGDDSYAGAWSPHDGARGIRLPSRAHEVCPIPRRPREALAVSRRPGEFLLRFDFRNADALHWHEAETDRVFSGHAAFSTDGTTLYTTETNVENGDGLIGVRDPVSLEKREEWATNGIGPHALLTRSDGSLLVANGGILTLPETGRRKLNLVEMDPSLVAIDSQGSMLGQWRLQDPRLSIRHIACTSDGQFAGLALQAEHEHEDQRKEAPVLALFNGGGLMLAETPASHSLQGYGGDIAYVEYDGKRHFAVSCPRAGVIALWDANGNYVKSINATRVCALAANNFDGDWVATSEEGLIWRLGESRRQFESMMRWDNHAKFLML
jgi:uncharacterized protein